MEGVGARGDVEPLSGDARQRVTPSRRLRAPGACRPAAMLAASKGPSELDGHVACTSPAVLRFIMLSLACSGCALSTDRLRMSVAHADRVELQSVGPRSGLVPAYDLAHPHTLLGPGSTLETVQAPFRGATVPARRNADGSIDLILGDRIWPIVRADGRITWLRDEAYNLDAAGVTWAFLSPPPDVHARTPWELRIATPRENVREAKIAVRREPLEGALFLALGAGLGACATSFFFDGGRSPPDGLAPFQLGVGAVVATAAALAIGYGLYALLVPPHDDVLLRR